MLINPYHVGPSLYGVGLFADRPIEKDELVYQFDWRFVQIFSNQEVASLPLGMRLAMEKYCYRGCGKDRLVNAMYYCLDDSRFMNHANTPSLYSDGQGNYHAAREILLGEELTCNYVEFCQAGELCFAFTQKQSI